MSGVCGLWFVVRGLWSVSIDSHVQYISFSFYTIVKLAQYLLCKYCTVLTSVDSNERQYCVVLTSVDSTDILCVSRILYSTLQSYIMSLLRKYCTVHYSRTLCHYYVNTVQYITYFVNSVQYITVVHYLVHKYCAVLTSVDSTDILCVSRILYSTLQSYIMSNTVQY